MLVSSRDGRSFPDVGGCELGPSPGLGFGFGLCAMPNLGEGTPREAMLSQQKADISWCHQMIRANLKTYTTHWQYVELLVSN